MTILRHKIISLVIQQADASKNRVEDDENDQIVGGFTAKFGDFPFQVVVDLGVRWDWIFPT